MKIKIKNGDDYNIQRDTGCYLLRCLVNGNLYVGSTKQNFRARFSNHYKFLSKGKLSNKELQNDFLKYGEDNFEFEILGKYERSLCTEFERQWVEKLKPAYNKIPVFNSSKTNLGKKFSKEHIDKIREKSKQFKHADLEKITRQNKEGATKFEVTELSSNKTFIVNSKLELSNLLGIKHCEFYYNREYNGFFIKPIKTQRKSVKLLVSGQWLDFKSFAACDRFLNKWRGFTSTQSLMNVSEIEGKSVRFN